MPPLILPKRLWLGFKNLLRSPHVLTNAFGKKPANFEAAVSLDLAYYNFVSTPGAIRATRRRPIARGGLLN